MSFTAQYRKRFIQLNMLLAGAVLFIALCVVAVVMVWQSVNALKSAMKEVIGPLEVIRPYISAGNADSNLSGYGGPPVQNHGNAPPAKPSDENPHEDRDMDDSRREIVTVFCRSDGSIQIVGENTLLDDESLKKAAGEAMSSSEEFGFLRSCGLLYYSRHDPDGMYRIALVSFGSLLRRMLPLFLTLFSVFAAAMGLFYLVARRISFLAARPMETAVSREKRFIADISHDLKTPLTVILANDSVLREHASDTIAGQLRWLDSTRDAAKNMQDLVNEMLTLSRMESPDAKPKTERVNFSAAATKAALQMESVAYEKGVELETEIQEGIFLSGGAEELQRVPASLIDNALKYEPSGGQVLVKLNLERGRAVLRVQNRLSAISPEDLPHIFERFYRGDKTRRSRSGHGLGLSITRRLVELSGGTITAENASGGAAFTVSFPALRSEE